MQIIDRNWPFHIVAIALTVAALCAWRFVMVGINGDFGFGFAMGAIAGGTIALLAVGFRQWGQREEVLPSVPEFPPKEVPRTGGALPRPKEN
jgi:hypothetical protein